MHHLLTRSTLIVLLTAALAVVGSGMAPAEAAVRPAASPATEEDAFIISYAEAMGWVDSLDADQREDQIRDYALLGLASLLGLDIEQLRNSFYDRTPALDPLFWDLTQHQLGPGRTLFDGENTLHILVPQGDPYEARNVGLALDNHRKDTGADPEFVTLYAYRIDSQDQLVHLQEVRTQDTPSMRREYGYVEMSLTNVADLVSFLERTQHLSRLTARDGELVAGGWNWPGVPAGRVTPEDLAVLQEGYLAARGEPITVAQFLTQYDTSGLDIDIDIPPSVAANAPQLDSFFGALSRADTNSDFAEFLDNQQQLVLDVILDQETSDDLRARSASMSHDDWLYELSVALGDAFDSNQLWPVLLYVTEEPFYVPAQGATEPGFSLDPAPVPSLTELIDTLAASRYPQLLGYQQEIQDFIGVMTASDDADAYWGFIDGHEDFILNAVLVGRETARARRLLSIAENARTSQAYADAYEEYADLILSAVDDRERPWQLLLYAADGKPPFQYARYDGGLAGTEAGMTYFYTDVLAKGYFYELGSGNPYGIVDGFVSKVHSSVPWSHCTLEDEQGRIWFGLNEDAVGFSQDAVNLGDVATRVFVLATDPVDGEREIEPSYMFGQGIWWWDRHYMQMADYEPQYHRLDQLMRWGAAIGWLVERDSLLPTPRAATVKDDWRFDEWLRQQPDLTWSYDIPFVEIDGIETETLLRLYSESYDVCGKSWISSGGISNPSLHRIAEIVDSQPELPATVARAGQSNAGTDYARQSAAGSIATLDGIRRNLKPLQPDRAEVEVVAPGRKVWSLGEIKVAVPETAERLMTSTILDADGELSWSTSVRDVPMGGVSVRTDGQDARIQWQPGPLAKAKTAMAKLQSLLVDFPLLEAINSAFAGDEIRSIDSGSLYAVCIERSVDGSCEDDNAWMVISSEPPADDAQLHFRLAEPHHEAGDAANEITWYYVSVVDSAPTGAVGWR